MPLLARFQSGARSEPDWRCPALKRRRSAPARIGDVVARAKTPSAFIDLILEATRRFRIASRFLIGDLTDEA